MKHSLSQVERAPIHQLIEQAPYLVAIVQEITQAGGQAFLVGGAVRDFLLGGALKDIDIEVHGIQLEDLKNILQKNTDQQGSVNFVGKSFGVFKVRNSGSPFEVDWSLPRTDSAGRKPDVAIDPNMGIEKALARRDLTINALAIDLATYELHDPFGGRADLEKKLLRCPDERFFIEDPLRFYRVMQFVGRFAMEPDQQLHDLCKKMDISTVSRERIEEEFKKLFLKASQPSRGIRWLHKLGRLQEILPEVAATVGVEQTPIWHPEGDVFQHTMQVLDAAADIRSRIKNEQGKIILMYAALCHDLGKTESTRVLADGKIVSRGHADTGVPLTKSLLARLCGHKKTIQTVAKLTKYHMEPGSFIKNNARVAAYKRLALKLAPETTLQMLAWLCEADKRGRNGKGDVPLPGPIEFVEKFVAKAREFGILHGPEEAILKGEHILDAVKPGPQLGRLLKKAYEIQINEGIRDVDTLKKRII